MNPPLTSNPYKRHRFPAEIISHCVWLYFRFCLSYRDVEELRAERGIILTYKAVRYWCRKFRQAFANQLHRRRPRSGDKWHLDEVFLTIHGERRYLWRAVDQDGHVLRYLGATSARHEGGEEVLPQALEGVNLCAAGDHHGSTEKLWGGPARDPAQCGTSAAPVSE
jgi:putative transposase